MKKPVKPILVMLASLALTMLINNTAWSAEPMEDLFILTTTSKSMDEVVNSVKTYAKKQKWKYLGDFKVKRGKVILVKFCVQDAGKIAWQAGLKYSAMLPCGNMGVYRQNGMTEISLLNPYYMTVLSSDLDLEMAADYLSPLYKEMLKSIVK